MAMVAYTYCE